MQPFSDLTQNTWYKKFQFLDPVVISETLPLVVIHGHFMNSPTPPLTTWYMDAPKSFYLLK